MFKYTLYKWHTSVCVYASDNFQEEFKGMKTFLLLKLKFFYRVFTPWLETWCMLIILNSSYIDKMFQHVKILIFCKAMHISLIRISRWCWWCLHLCIQIYYIYLTHLALKLFNIIRCHLREFDFGWVQCFQAIECRAK